MRHLDRLWVPAVITAIAYAVFVWNMLEVRKHDISHFVIAGGEGVDRTKVPPGLTVFPDAYDGLTFYRLAVNPFTRTATEHGITLDNPPYRHQRIGYPLIVWAMSFGEPRLVPALLVAVNFLALIVMGVLGGALARHYGHHALLGLIFPAFPGFMISISRDLSEIVVATFALGAIVAVEKGRFGWAALLLSYALLTRETTLIIAAALGMAWLADRLRKRERRVAPVAFVVPITVFIAWQAVLWRVWGAFPVVAGAIQWTSPFSQYWRVFSSAIERQSHLQRVYFVECAFLPAILIIALVAWHGSRAAPAWRWALAGTLVLVSVLPRDSWLDDFGFLRVVVDYYVPSAVLIIGSRWAAARWSALALAVPVWGYLARHFIGMG